MSGFGHINFSSFLLWNFQLNLSIHKIKRYVVFQVI
jgi:hypothetical protein